VLVKKRLSSWAISVLNGRTGDKDHRGNWRRSITPSAGTRNAVDGLGALIRPGDLYFESGDEVRSIQITAWRLEMLSSRRRTSLSRRRAGMPWEKVGGQETAHSDQDAIELPLLHVDLFKKFQHATPKGFLLYGRRVAARRSSQSDRLNLTKQLERKNGRGHA